MFSKVQLPPPLEHPPLKNPTKPGPNSIPFHSVRNIKTNLGARLNSDDLVKNNTSQFQGPMRCFIPATGAIDFYSKRCFLPPSWEERMIVKLSSILKNPFPISFWKVQFRPPPKQKKTKPPFLPPTPEILPTHPNSSFRKPFWGATFHWSFLLPRVVALVVGLRVGFLGVTFLGSWGPVIPPHKVFGGSLGLMSESVFFATHWTQPFGRNVSSTWSLMFWCFCENVKIDDDDDDDDDDDELSFCRCCLVGTQASPCCNPLLGKFSKEIDRHLLMNAHHYLDDQPT